MLGVIVLNKSLQITFQYGGKRKRGRVSQGAAEVWEIVSRLDHPGQALARLFLSSPESERLEAIERNLGLVLSALDELRASLNSVARKLDALASAGEVDVKRAAAKDDRLKSLEEAIDRAIDRFLA